MVFEDFLNKAVKRKTYSFILGILYVLIGYYVSKLIFPNDISIATIIITTLLFVPSLSKLISIEEKIERRDGTHNFFRDHKTLMEIFLFLFIGIFIGYLIIGTVSSNSIQYQLNILESQGALNISGKGGTIAKFTSIIINNIEVILIAFVLSLFLGAGALFLLVRTASVFSAFIIKFSELISVQTKLVAAVFSLHFIPEIFGFLLAALAGGVISKAIVREKIGTKSFSNVVKDSTILLLLALALIIIAAALEVFVTPNIIIIK